MEQTLLRWIDALNRSVGKAVACLTGLLVLLVCSDVFLRKVFSLTANWVVELEWHLFALIFLLSAGYALAQHRHVRVDVFYQNFSERDKAWVNLLGFLFLLLPWCLVLLWVGAEYTWNAYHMGEGSPDPGGLPYRFFIKAMIPMGVFLLLLQGLAEALRALNTLKKS